MLAVKVICPHCGKHLKMSKPPVVGHRVLCSRCGRSFAPTDVHAGIAKGPPPLVSPVTEAPIRRDPEGSAKQTLGIGLVLGGLLLLLVTTIVLVVYFASRKGPQDVSVQASVAPSEAENGTVESSPPDNPNSLPSDNRDEVPPPPPPPPPEEGRKEPALKPTSASLDDRASWLPPAEQEQVNKAIDRAVQWVKKHQGGNGSWGRGPHEVGLAALPALTLLECGVPADDILIQKARFRVREALPRLNRTYELSLAILFLDRLGDAADKRRIQTCALRLVAGQSSAGGWSYTCPLLTPRQEDDLLTVMRERRPRSAMDLFVGGPGGSAPPGFVARDPAAPLDKSMAGDSKLLPEGGVLPLNRDRPDPVLAKQALDRLPIALRKTPALQPPRTSHKLPPHDESDNSNTQFAILGLLAAARHDLPLERACALIVHRFHVSQLPDGRWNYKYASPPRYADVRPAMTGAGLLGLAVQYGLAADHAQGDGQPGSLDDPAVEKGFHYLAEFIGKPLGAKRPRAGRNPTGINLYFLWTVERCGVLYQRRRIDGKDWYRWGAELLLDHQQGDGSWNADGYYTSATITPVTDTCFALLFLKRANLAKDLTKKLEFFIEGKQLR